MPGAFDQGARADRDEARQVLILGAQAERHPGAQAGRRGDPLARIHLKAAAGMIDVVGDHRTDHAQLVDARSDVRKELAHLEAGLAPFVEGQGEASRFLC